MMITRHDCYYDAEHRSQNLNVELLPNDEILNKFPPELRNIVAEIWRNGKVGLCAGNMQIISLQGFEQDEIDNTHYADSFTLSLPFAGHSLLWDIKFSHRNLHFAPDIDFDDETFFHGINGSSNLLQDIKSHIQSWVKWDVNNSKSLVNFLKEWLQLYKKHQIDLLTDNEKYSRLSFEYSSLVGETGVSIDEVEVLVEPSDVVHFLINISVDFSTLPIYIQENELNKDIENPGPDAAMLMVTFHKLDGSKIQPQLFLSPHVEQVLGGAGIKHIPPFSTQGCLMDYVPEVRRILADKVDGIATNYRMKNEYVNLLLAQYGCTIVEYDCMAFSKVTLLFVMKNFYWLLNISLGNKFPYEKPKFVLRSVYHTTCGKPCTEMLSDYPYSPRWNPDEMIQRSFTYTFDKISSFQNTSVQKNDM